jgi:hypothetical protein
MHIRFIENTINNTVTLQYRILGFIWITNKMKLKNKVIISKFKTKHEALKALQDKFNVDYFYIHSTIKKFKKL